MLGCKYLDEKNGLVWSTTFKKQNAQHKDKQEAR
jgi:hypothetical protein